jgi:hypothetical protein
MGLAIAVVGVALSAGYATVRLLGLAKGAAAVALIPAAGLAVTAVLTTWCGLLGAPAPVAGVVMLGCSLVGLWLLVDDRDWLLTSVRGFWQQDRAAAVVLIGALIVPVVCIGIAFGQVEAPLSPHDGAFHVETTELFRRGLVAPSWYPPGLAALFGAILQLSPWVDTAAGSSGLGFGLALLVPIAIFGLGATVWRHLLAASAAALLAGFTYLFPYYPQIWSGWPQTIGLLIVMAIWSLALMYVERPSWALAVLAGLLVGAVVVVHGTELYTSAIVVVAIALGHLRNLHWSKLVVHVGLAMLIALVCAAAYLPLLFHWAEGGGALAVGYEDGTALATGAKSTISGDLLLVYTLNALGIDLPIRLAIIVLGLVWVVRHRTGWTTVGIAAAFYVLAVVASFLNGLPLVRDVYAATYPWSLPFRLLMVATIPLALVAGVGAVQLTEVWQFCVSKVKHPVVRRLTLRTGRVLALTWAIVTTVVLTAFLSPQAERFSSFSSNDAVAMAWLRAHASPGDRVANDGFADAGIWTPYKAGLPIVQYRTFSDPSEADIEADALRDLAHLDTDSAAMRVACALHVRWLYYGAKDSTWQARNFPPLAELQALPALREAFSSGAATVFEVRDTCP